MSIALSTPVAIAPAPFGISHADKVLLMGSCFTDNIGERLQQAGFDVLCNPFGVLYNPLSIATCLLRSATGDTLHDDDLVFHDGMWHSWLHHSRFSATEREECMARCNASLNKTRQFLTICNTIIITLGTAFVYHLISNPDAPSECSTQRPVVANCHRVPAEHFERRLASIEQCMAALESMPFEGKRVILTISPIRHLADGAHGNQISKATLLLASERYLNNRTNAYYFPAYELLLDEMRDYRFYDTDMTHPSSLAVDIIWQRFQDTFFSSVTQNQCRIAEKDYRRHQHRPIANSKL